MATYYVDPTNGNDANNGLGPDASHASNKPWATIGKALGASGIASADTVYLAPGTYREVVTVNMTSATAETKVLGDPSNAQGFKTSAGARVAPGAVTWTGYTTNDKTAPSATSVLTMNGRDYLTFNNIFFVQGAAVTVNAGTTTSQFIVFRDCAFISYGPAAFAHIQVNGVAGGGTALEWTVDRCRFFSRSNAIQITINQAASGTANNDIKFVVKNCINFSTANFAHINFAGTASTGDKPGGVVVRNCTLIGMGGAVQTTAAWSTTVPVVVSNCVLLNGNSSANLNANASGQITESYNLIYGSTPRTNVTAGTGSVSDGSYAGTFHFGQELLWSGMLRPFGEPMASSPLLAFGNDGNQDTYDVLNRPKPAGGASATPAVGAMERGNTFGKETSTVRTGSSAISITGPGYQDFELPVNTDATTVNVWVQWDATYTGTKPKMSVLNGAECGVADATTTATGSSEAWEQLSLTFNATLGGIVTVRLQSSDTNGGGKMFADDWLVI